MDFWQTLLISLLPALLTGLISYFAAAKNANTQIKSIREQNKADIEKIVEQNKVDIISLQEKHRLEMEMMEKEHLHEMERIKEQNQNEIKKDEENIKNQLAASVLGGLFEGAFSKDSPISKEINNAIMKELKKQ